MSLLDSVHRRIPLTLRSLDQYLRFVKPSFDNFILPTSRYADVIVPGMNNEIAVDLIANHIRQQLDERKHELRTELFKANVEPAALSQGSDGVPSTGELEGDCGGENGLPDTVFALEQTPQIRVRAFESSLSWSQLTSPPRQGIQTILRDKTTSIFDFIFHANRLSTLVIEHALTLLPTRSKPIITGTQIPYEGQELAVDAGHLCSVSILRSGASLEKGLRRVLRDVAVGSVLIQSCKNGEPLLYHVELPEVLTLSKESAAQSFVLLLDSQIGTVSLARSSSIAAANPFVPRAQQPSWLSGFSSTTASPNHTSSFAASSSPAWGGSGRCEARSQPCGS